MGDMLNSARGDERDGEDDPRYGGETKEGHYFRKIQELEQQLLTMEGKYRESQNINTELADKIQQLEFDKDMMYKENVNLKKRSESFQGLLDSSEVEAQLEYKEGELAEYRKKLEEERSRSEEYVAELKEEIAGLKKQQIKLMQNEEGKARIAILQ